MPRPKRLRVTTIKDRPLKKSRRRYQPILKKLRPLNGLSGKDRNRYLPGVPGIDKIVGDMLTTDPNYGPRKGKYGAVPTWFEGRRFASKKEARRFAELRVLEKAGLVRNIELQPVFPMILPDGTRIMTKRGVCYIYKADFSYEYFSDNGRWVKRVEDVKGFDTPLSTFKRAVVYAIHKQTIDII